MEPLRGNNAAQQVRDLLEGDPKDNMNQFPSFQEFLKLLNENGRAVQGQDLSLMAWYLEGMEHQFNVALQELRDARAELAQMTDQQAPAKSLLTDLVKVLEDKVELARERLAALQNKIVECAKDAADRFKDAGVSVLDSALSAMGVKKGLEHLQEGLQSSLSGMKETLAKAEDMGVELRQAGQHLKNSGRIMAGKDVQVVDGGQAGRFQSAVLAPMRGVHKLLSNINNNTLAAIGVVEGLEQSADVARDRQAERVAQRPGKRLEKKPSLLRDLAEKKAVVAAQTPPDASKSRKLPEVEL